jgi:translation initiation factor 1 (eIF-1/SUI1)
MAQKAQKIDVSSSRNPLTDSPFGALGELKTSLPDEPVAPLPPRAEIIDEMAVFRVHKTRKGGWPVSFEKRAAGKLVTVIQNVSGDGNALLKLLRKHCATGGVYKDGAIELQGDHRAKVGAWFDKHLA